MEYGRGGVLEGRVGRGAVDCGGGRVSLPTEDVLGVADVLDEGVGNENEGPGTELGVGAGRVDGPLELPNTNDSGLLP